LKAAITGVAFVHHLFCCGPYSILSSVFQINNGIILTTKLPIVFFSRHAFKFSHISYITDVTENHEEEEQQAKEEDKWQEEEGEEVAMVLVVVFGMVMLNS
jgi:hypothetical protein